MSPRMDAQVTLSPSSDSPHGLVSICLMLWLTTDTWMWKVSIWLDLTLMKVDFSPKLMELKIWFWGQYRVKAQSYSFKIMFHFLSFLSSNILPLCFEMPFASFPFDHLLSLLWFQKRHKHQLLWLLYCKSICQTIIPQSCVANMVTKSKFKSKGTWSQMTERTW